MRREKINSKLRNSASKHRLIYGSSGSGKGKDLDELVKRKQNAVDSLKAVIKNNRQSVYNSASISMCFDQLASFQSKENP